MLIEYEPYWRIGAFVGILLMMAIWEGLTPYREPLLKKAYRWSRHLALVGLNTLVLRLCFPIMAVGVASWASLNGYGLLNGVDWPAWAGVLISLLVLDLTIYWQHRLFHRIPALWAIHSMHHADQEFDTSTAIRFHPIEIVLSMLIKMAVVVLIGAPVEAVIVFEILLNGFALFNHGNVRLPSSVERWGQVGVITPDVHRVHHSSRADEMHHNFGFTTCLWDRLFGSYKATSVLDFQKDAIGVQVVSGLDATTTASLREMLAFPARVWKAQQKKRS